MYFVKQKWYLMRYLKYKTIINRYGSQYSKTKDMHSKILWKFVVASDNQNRK